MSKKPYVFVNQLKIVQSITEQIDKIIAANNQLRKQPRAFFRTQILPNKPTLYQQGGQGRANLIVGSNGTWGARDCDYKFVEGNPDWVEASEEHGLSFSTTTDHAVSTLNFLGKFQKPGTKINCCYWILSDHIMIPTDMAFVPNGEGHYLLAVTKSMHIDTLIGNLEWIGNRMSIMELQLEAYKK